MRLPADGEEAKRIVGARATGRGCDRIHRIANAARCLRRRSTTLRNCSGTPTGCSASARRTTLDTRAGSVRTPQADQLSAHRQPPSFADVAQTLPRIVKAIERAVSANCSRRAPESVRSGDASWTIRKSPITTPSSRPPSRPAKSHHVRGRAEDLRFGLPPPAQRLARRSHLVGDHRHHGDSQRRDRGPLSHLRQRVQQSAGRCWTLRRRAKKRRRAKRRRRAERRAGAAVRISPRSAAGCVRMRGR